MHANQSNDAGQLASLEQRAERLLQQARDGWFDASDTIPRAAALRAITAALELADKFMWQVRDTCVRAEKAEAALSAQLPESTKHPDDVAVDLFASAMKTKLEYARNRRGRGGWQNKSECSVVELSAMLRDHVSKGDPTDVANFCCFLWNRQEAIAAQPRGVDDGCGELFGWKCNNCSRVFTSPQQTRAESDNGGPKCPFCKVEGQYTYPYALHHGDPCKNCGTGHDQVAQGACAAPQPREVRGVDATLIEQVAEFAWKHGSWDWDSVKAGLERFATTPQDAAEPGTGRDSLQVGDAGSGVGHG